MSLIPLSNSDPWSPPIYGPHDITDLIALHRDGDDGAYDQVVELLYGELRARAHGQLVKLPAEPTLQTTALVHEVYIKLKESSGKAVDRDHFLALAATAMRHVVIDYARARRSDKRGGGARHMPIEDSAAAVDAQAEDLLQIDEALGALGEQSKRLVRVFECKFFGGLDDDETARVLRLSKRTAQRDWMKARAFLSEYLADHR